MLTLSSMENLIVECSRIGKTNYIHWHSCFCLIKIIFTILVEGHYLQIGPVVFDKKIL